MSNSLVIMESNQDLLESNLSFNERDEEILKNQLKEIIAEIYPNKEHFDVKEIFKVLKLFDEKKIIELKREEFGDSIEALVNQYDSELQDVSLSDICNLILAFIPGENIDLSTYDSELSFISDINMKLNPNIVDESKEEIHVLSVESNQNNNNVHSFNDNMNQDNKSNSNLNNEKYSNINQHTNNKVNKINKNPNENNNDKVIPSEGSLNEKFTFESYGKESNMPYSSSSDDLRIIKLDKQSASDIINFSNLLDAEAQSLLTDSILKDNSKEKNKIANKNNSIRKSNSDDNFETITDISSLKFDTDNTEKYFKELALLLRQNLKKSMDNCQNLCNDLKLRDTTIKSLKSEIEQLRKNFEENNKKLTRSEKEIDILKQREAKLLENIRQFSEKELEQEKNATDLKTKYNKLEKRYNSQQTELNKVHEKSQKHFSELKQKEEELKLALEEVDKCRDGIKIEEEKQIEMKKKLLEYEEQLKSVPVEMKEEISNNDLKWKQILKEQKEIYEEQYAQLQEEIIKKNKEGEELIKRNNELLNQIESLTNQLNDLKAERDLDLSLSQSLKSSTGMVKNLNVELHNALTKDQDKNKKLEENEDIKNLTEKCEILEKEIEVIKNEKQELVEKEKQWNTEKEENIMLITEYLEPNLKRYMDNEIILKNTIEVLNKEVTDLKEDMDMKVQELLKKSKEQVKEQEGNNKDNNIKSIVHMVNDAVQTSDDMKDVITQLEKGLDDINDINNELIDKQMEPPTEFYMDQSELIITDENYLDSEVPVISCNISIIDDDLAKLNEKNNKKLDVVTEEILNDNEMDIIENSSSELKFTNNQNIKNIINEAPLAQKKGNSKDSFEITNKNENTTKDKKENKDKDKDRNKSKNKNKNKNDNDNENINENEYENIIMKNNFKIKEANQTSDEKFNTYPKEGIKNIINQKDNFTKMDSSDPNIPISDRRDSKITNNKDDCIVKKSEDQEVIKNSLNKSTISVNQDSTSTTSTTPHKKNKYMVHKKKKYDSKTIFSFIFLQSFIIFATAISVILTIEKMLGIRIIMKFVDIFLEDEHYIKEESSPS